MIWTLLAASAFTATIFVFFYLRTPTGCDSIFAAFRNPTLRLSNNQVVKGFCIHITRDGNPGLIDQTNRQGIVDSREFDDFKIAVEAKCARQVGSKT